MHILLSKEENVASEITTVGEATKTRAASSRYSCLRNIGLGFGSTVYYK
jgi:hypothetical protein